jgi:hypothetical protein
VKNNDGIERQIKGEYKKKAIEGINNGMLRVRKERMARELKGIPEREITPFDTFDPEISWRNKIRSEISLRKKKTTCENIIKKEDGRKKKGQTTQDIG